MSTRYPELLRRLFAAPVAKLGKRTLLTPAVGQSGQDYFAAYHERLRHLHAVKQHDLSLGRDAAVAESYRELPESVPFLAHELPESVPFLAHGSYRSLSPSSPTDESVGRFLSVVDG